jgi:hypothetical protein
MYHMADVDTCEALGLHDSGEPYKITWGILKKSHRDANLVARCHWWLHPLHSLG